MSISDDDLARAKNISVEQVRLLRESRGTTNETLEALPDAAIRRALHGLAYPDRPDLRAEFRFQQQLGDDGAEPPPEAVETAVNELHIAVVSNAAAQTAGVPTRSTDATPGGTAAADAEAAAGISTADWEWLGPANVGGRTRGIAIHPSEPRRMWAASAGGGVWHTQDGGATWTTVDDFLANLACPCIAMDPSNPLKIYVGTGEGFGNGDAIKGNGIFATSDGVHWAVLPATRNFPYVTRIAVAKSGVMLAGLGHKDATPVGIFRSADAERADRTTDEGLRVGRSAIRRLGCSEIIDGRARAVTPRSPQRSRTT